MKKYWTVFALSARFIFWPAAAITLLGALASAAVLLSQAESGARLDSAFFNNATVTALASVRCGLRRAALPAQGARRVASATPWDA